MDQSDVLLLLFTTLASGMLNFLYAFANQTTANDWKHKSDAKGNDRPCKSCQHKACMGRNVSITTPVVNVLKATAECDGTSVDDVGVGKCTVASYMKLLVLK